MKTFLKNFAILAVALGTTSYAYAAPVCGNTGNACETPVATTQSAITINASNLLGLECLNSVGPNGNAIGSNYFFAVSNTDLGATVANGSITNGANGSSVVGVSPTHNASATTSSLVTAGAVQGTKGGTGYWIYAQACPTGAVANGANCSSWAKVDTSQITTTAYPTSVFSAPTKPTDATVNSINMRTAVPNGDVSNVSDILNISVNDLITPANSQSLSGAITFTGNPGPYTINNAQLITQFNFIPNTKYSYSAQVQYPWDQVPIAGPQTITSFWTTPENPFNVVASNPTHCSVQITAENSNGAPGNPSYTDYTLCTSAGPSTCPAAQAIGSNNPTTTVTATISGLNPGTPYTPTAQALVGNGDGSSAGWNSSGVTDGTNFTTLAWGGSSSISNITTTSANYNFPGLDTTGVVSYQIILNGNSLGVVSGVPTSPYLLNTLTPNTQYTVALKLSETNCTSPVILNQSFTTTPVDPNSFTLSAASPFSLTAIWVGGTNPANTVYQVQYCTDAAFTQNCQTMNSGAGLNTVTLTTGVNPVTTYYAHVKALTIGGGSDSNYSNSASATTPPNQSGITISPPTATINTGAQQTFTANVVDQNGQLVNNPQVTWTALNGGGNLVGSNPAATINFAATTPGGPYYLKGAVTVLGTTYTSISTITVSATGPAFTTNPTATVNTDNITGSLHAIANDGALNATPITYTWSLYSGPSPVTFGNTNGTTTGTTVSITFSKAGSYVFQCVAQDNFGSVSTPLTSPVPVNQLLNGILVCPAGQMTCSQSTPITVQALQAQQFTANGIDQFGSNMTLVNTTWTVTGCSGCVGANTGVFQTATIGQQFTITATGSDNFGHTKNGFALVNVVSFDVSGAIAYPVPYKANSGIGHITFSGLGSQASIHIYTTSGRRVFDVEVNTPTYDWNVKNTSGESIASGVYFYVIQSPLGKKNGKLIIIQ